MAAVRTGDWLGWGLRGGGGDCGGRRHQTSPAIYYALKQYDR